MSTISVRATKRSPTFWPRKNVIAGDRVGGRLRGGEVTFAMANCLAGDVLLDNCYVFDLPKSGNEKEQQQQPQQQQWQRHWQQGLTSEGAGTPISTVCSVQRPRSERRRLRDLFHKQTAGKTARKLPA